MGDDADKLANASLQQRAEMLAELEQWKKHAHNCISQEIWLRTQYALLKRENWQLKGALGYEVPGDIPPGDFKCGLCDAKTRELEEQRDLCSEALEMFDKAQRDHEATIARFEKRKRRAKKATATAAAADPEIA